MNESEVQVLRTEFQGLKTEFHGLETRLNERFQQSEKHREELFNRFEKHFDSQFNQIGKQLEEMNSRSKDLDELLRGKNGNPGMNGRLNHTEKMQTFFLWVGGISLTGFFGILAVFVAKYLDLVDQLRNSV